MYTPAHGREENIMDPKLFELAVEIAAGATTIKYGVFTESSGSFWAFLGTQR
jgi:hypothetical protein